MDEAGGSLVVSVICSVLQFPKYSQKLDIIKSPEQTCMAAPSLMEFPVTSMQHICTEQLGWTGYYIQNSQGSSSNGAQG